MKEYECTEEIFLKDIKNHKLNILKDDGIYRHLVFKRPDTNCYRFDIVTYLGYLVISGDMGCQVFSRLTDMFEFFRTDDRDFNKNRNGVLSINPSYWNEKVVSGNDNKEFSEKLLKKIVIEYIDSKLYDEDWTEYEIDELKDDILADISYSDTNPVRMYDLINEYRFEGDSGKTFEFQDWLEYASSCQEYTFHYIWQCYAIAYAVQEYDTYKLGVVNE